MAEAAVNVTGAVPLEGQTDDSLWAVGVSNLEEQWHFLIKRFYLR